VQIEHTKLNGIIVDEHTKLDVIVVDKLLLIQRPSPRAIDLLQPPDGPRFLDLVRPAWSVKDARSRVPLLRDT
jgi:hypothetical protein